MTSVVAVRLKHVTEGMPSYGVNVSSEEYREDGFRLLRTTDITDHGEINGDAEPVFVDRDTGLLAPLRANDMLLSRSGTVGRALRVREEMQPVTHAGYLIRFRPDQDRIDPRFLEWAIRGQAFQDQVTLHGIQSTIVNVNAQRYASMMITHHPLELQCLIADFLDRETHRIDALVDAKRRMIELIAEKRRSVVSQVIAESGGPLARVRRAVRSITSGSRGWAAHYADEGRPFIRISNVSAEGIELNVSDLIRVQPPPSKERTRTEAEMGDVVVSITADVGSVAVIEDPSLLPSHISQHVALLRLRETSLPRYLAYSMTTSAAQAAFDAARYGGTKTQLALNDVLDIPIQLPDRSIQDEVVSRLDRDTQVAEAAIQALTRQLDLLAEYRQALITQAVTGQLDEATLKGDKPIDEAVGVIPE